MLLVFVSLLHAADLPPEIEPYTWIVGEWHGQTEERWVPAGDALWSVALAGDGYEVCRIALVDGRVTYLASPGGAAPTPFVDVGGGQFAGGTIASVSFQNASHDFPQVIRYDRSGDRLAAQVGQLDEAPAFSLRWRRVEPRVERALVEADGGNVVASGRRRSWGYTIGEGVDGAYASVWRRTQGTWERVATVR